MAKLNLPSKTFTLLSLLVVVVLVGYFLLYPFWNKLATSRDGLASAQAEQAKLKQASSDLNNFLAEFQGLSEEANITALALPSKPDTANLLANFEALSRQSGLTLASFNFFEEPNAAVKGSAFAVTPLGIEIIASGSFPSFQDFLLRLETHLRILDVDSVVLRSEEAGILDYQIKLRTYFQK